MSVLKHVIAWHLNTAVANHNSQVSLACLPELLCDTARRVFSPVQWLHGMRQGRTRGSCSGQVGPRLIRARPHGAPPPARSAPFSRVCC